MNFTFVETTLIIILAALVVSVVFRAFRLPPILGYLVVGAFVGPHVMGWLTDTQDIRELAEFGIALLMFTIGLEFSLSKLISLRFSVFVLGGLQVLLSIGATVLVGAALEMTLVQSLVIGCILAMSSTAIVVKQLSDQFEIQSKHGLNAVSILLFQDIAVVPILILVANLSGNALANATIVWGLAKGIAAVVLIIAIGRWLLRPLFHLIASTRMLELFTLSVLFVAIGAAWLSNEMGMSYALGAFLAGIMLGETEFRHQIEAEIRPFRDVLLGLFFISIGMLVNISTWADTWAWILVLLAGIMLGKSLLIVLLCRFLNYDFSCATRTGVILSQGGEFGFAILSVALVNHLLPTDYGQVVLASLLISFALAPIIIKYNKTIAKTLFPKSTEAATGIVHEDVESLSAALSNHSIICGYGKVGQNIAICLKHLDYPYIGLDLDPKIIKTAKQAGDCVAYGNTTNIEILKSAKLDEASSVVISFDDTQAALKIISQVRLYKPDIPILARCRDEVAYNLLRDSGATRVVTEVFEESITLASELLQCVKVPSETIFELLQQTRGDNYALLHQLFPGSASNSPVAEGLLHEHLHIITLPEGAMVIGQRLVDCQLDQSKLISVRRGKQIFKPDDELRLQAGDVLIIYASLVELEDIQAQLF